MNGHARSDSASDEPEAPCQTTGDINITLASIPMERQHYPRREYRRKYRAENGEKLRAYYRKWYAETREKTKESYRKYRAENRERLRAIKRKWKAKRHDHDDEY